MSGLPFELLLALRYLRPKRTFVSVITLISVLGVMLGVAVLIIVISVMTGFDHDLRERILGFNPHVTVMMRNGATIHGYEPLMRTISSNQNVRAVAPLALGRVLVETEPQSGQARFEAPLLRGIDPNLEPRISTLPTNVVAGEFNVRGRGVLVGRTLAANLDLSVGDRVSIYSPSELIKMRESKGKQAILPSEFEVRGIFDVGYEEFNAGFMVTSLPEMQELYALDDSVHGLIVVTKDPDRASETKAQLEDTLGPEFHISTWMEENASLLGAVMVEKNMMFYLLFFIMIVAALCIMNVLITFVVQKTREIGMLKALGATGPQVAGLFLSQSAVIGVVGVATGFGLAWLAIAYRNEFLHFMRRVTHMELFPVKIYGFGELPALIVPRDVIIICGSALLICLLGGVFPAWRAARLKPVDALRYE
jgi:lipoprotein-releasing system permease protein